MKENMNVEPTGTMPAMGAMPQMQANPNISPIQSGPKSGVSPEMMPMKPNPMGVMPSMMNQMPIQPNPMGVSPSMMNQMPVQANPMGVMPSMMNPMPMMCCPYLMNMQCPMTMGMGMNNPMLTGVSPAMGAANPVLGAANQGMNTMPAMGAMPSMNPYFPMGGMY